TLRIGKVPGSVLRVSAPESLGDEHFHWLTEKVLSGIAEELLGLGVDEQDATFPIHHHHRIGCGLEEAAELVLGLPAVGDVADRARDERALLGLERAQADLDRELGAVLSRPIELQARSHGADLRFRE